MLADHGADDRLEPRMEALPQASREGRLETGYGKEKARER